VSINSQPKLKINIFSIWRQKVSTVTS